jgi:hypothetical protein
VIRNGSIGAIICLSLLSACYTNIWELSLRSTEGYREINATGVVYTSALTGSDENPGTREFPFASINSAISQLDRVRGEGEIHVAAGTYLSDYPVVIKDGISLYGGYSSATWDREPTVHLTTIRSTYDYTLYFKAGVTEATIVDGFRIEASGEPGDHWAVYCFNASPTISNNWIIGGNTYDYSGAIIVKYGSPRIFNNELHGGEASATWGIHINDATPIICCNRINGGDANLGASAVYCIESSIATVRNNYIHGGTGDNTSGISGYDNCSLIVCNNTIYGGVGASSSTGIINNSPGAIIVNNIICTDPASVYAFGIDTRENCHESEVRNNNFYNTPHLYWYASSGFDALDVGSMETFLLGQGVVCGENVEMDPEFHDFAGGDWRLTASTPTQISQGGTDLSTEFNTDYLGSIRTVPWSIGAHEYNP